MDTKTRIFHVALRLFAASGVENVSMRDIADTVGIKAASIYNHYINKEQIVEACYDYFLQYNSLERLNKEQYTAILLNGTKQDVINITLEQFSQDIAEYLTYAMIVLFSRIYTDEKAEEIYTIHLDRSLQFLSELFETGIELGRFESFNVRAVSQVQLSTRLFAAQFTFLQLKSIQDPSLSQQEMAAELINILPFKY